MKSRLLSTARLSFPLATAISALLSTHSAQAVAHFWDNNSTTTGFGNAGGTWGTSALWTLTSGGGAPHSGVTLISTSDQANFGTDTAGNGLGGGTINVSGTVNAASLRFGNQTTSNVTLSGGTINLAATTSIHVGAGGGTVHTITSNITGASTSLTKTGNTLQLSANNSYTGQTIISSGTLILNNSAVLGGNNPGVNGTSSISMGANSTLQSNYIINDGGNVDSFVYAPITLTAAGNNNFLIGAGSSTAPPEAVTFNLNGAIGGSAGANVVFGNTTATRNNADSIVVLGAASTYNGNTTIQAGHTANRINVKAGVDDALPTSTVLSFDAVAGSGSGRFTQYDLSGNNQTLAGLTNGGIVANLRNLRVTNTGALATLTINNTANFTFGGSTLASGTTTRAQITGAISLVKDGTGTFTLGGTLTGGATAGGNTFTGTTKILGGILVLAESNSIQNSTFDTAGSIAGDADNGLRTTVTTLTMGALTGGNDLSSRFTTTSGGYSAVTALTLNPGTAVVRTYGGDIGAGNTSISLTKTGAGTQILSGVQTYTGATNINGGTLRISATGSTDAGSAVTVGISGTLAGKGTINGSATINGTLAPGESPGVLSFGSTLTLANSATTVMEIDGAVRGDEYDGVNIADALVYDGALILDFGTALGLGDYSYNLFNFTPGDDTGEFNSITLAGAYLGADPFVYDSLDQWELVDGDNTWTFTQSTGVLNLVVVPEPSTALLGGLGLLALLRRRRK